MSTRHAVPISPGAVPSPPNQVRQDAPRGLLLRSNCRAAFKALMANGTRSFLTMLGVIIGVAAVITAVTQAEGTSESINQRFASFGTNVLTVQSGEPPGQQGAFIIRKSAGGAPTSLTLSDVRALTTLPHVSQVGPVIQAPGTQTIFRNQNGQFQVSGVSANYPTFHGLQLAEGAWFNSNDEESAAPNVVIGSVVAQSLFSPLKVDPIGQTVRIGSQLFHVVGVLASSNFIDDESIYAPFKTVQVRLVNATTVDQIEVLVDDTNNIDLVQEEITSLLRQRHRINGGKDDFWVQSANQLIQNKQASASSLATLLIGIAAVSLTVGGIGIMNIMLVSVTERTREIGIRLAVGARRSDIRNQFLIEAIALSAVGGAIGVFFGIFIGYEIVVSAQLPFILDSGAVLLAVGVAGLIGIIFGLYPAIRAADLDPIVALRTI